MKVLSHDRVTNLQELIVLCSKLAAYAGTDPETIYLEATFNLVIDKLSDGSEVYDIRIHSTEV